MTDTQKLQIANGILRIRQAIKNCDLPVSEVGTFYSYTFKLHKLEKEMTEYTEIHGLTPMLFYYKYESITNPFRSSLFY